MSLSMSNFLCHLPCEDSDALDKGMCLQWQVRDEMWEQEVSGLSTVRLSLRQGTSLSSQRLVMSHQLPFPSVYKVPRGLLSSVTIFEA